MKYLSDKGLNYLIQKTVAGLKKLEDSIESTENANTAAQIATAAAKAADDAAQVAAEATAAAEQSAKECADLVAEVEQKLENGEFTPKKNVDYFTPEEKQEMVNDVLASLPRDITVTSWKAVQEVVRAGKAAEVFSIGDQIECQHAVYGTLLWDVIGIDHDTPVDSQYQHSITLQLHDILPEKFLFDPREPNSPYPHHQRYGGNIWRDSAIRQWLNSDGTAGNWWNAQTDWDVAPGYATTHNAFLHGLDEDFLSVIGAVSKTSALNEEEPEDIAVTEDKFFLLSKTEVYWGANYGVEEGVVYPYYSLFSDLESPSYTYDTNRIKYRQGEACQWMLRSIMQDLSSTTRDVYAIRATGNFHHHGGYNADGIAPACCIY